MKQKHLLKEFTGYVSLNVAGMIGLSCYILADTYFIANRLGADGLAALNLVLPLYSLISGMGLMVGIGGATRFAICQAHGDGGQSDRVFSTSAAFGIGVGSFFLFLGLFASKFLASALGASGNILPMAETYLKILMCFAPFFILNNILTAFVRNDGDPSLAMLGMLIGSFSNVLMDYLFLYPLNLGMAGAALATAVSPVIGMLVQSVHILRKKNRFHFRVTGIEPKRLPGILSLGVSAFVNELSSGLVLAVFNLLILGIAGNVGVAAYGIVANLALVALAVFTGVSQGCQPLISRFYGRGEEQEIRKIFLYSTVLSVVLGALLALAAYLLNTPLVAAFNSEKNPELARIASEGLRIYFPGFLAAGVNVTAAAGLGAMDRAKESFFIAILRGCVGILFFAVLLSRIFGMTGIWLSFGVTEAGTLLASWRFVRKATASVHGKPCISQKNAL